LSTNGRFAILLSFAGAVAGCSGNTAFPGSSVALSVTPDGSLGSVVMEELTVEVSGADTSTFTVAATSGLGAGQAQTIDYVASAAAGTLQFTITGLAHGMPVATGAGSVDVKPRGVARLAITLAAVVGPDMAMTPPDMATPPDLAMPPADLHGVVTFDLLSVDLAHGPIVPSNTTVPYNPNAADLSGVVAIDTSGLQLAIAAGAGNDGGTLAAPPSGVGFVVNGSFAVLTVGKWTVDKEVRVTGARALIVVAKSVDIKNVIHLEAVAGAAGPGGFAPTGGPGHGANGGTGVFTIPPSFSIPTASGGGGAGHGSPGGNGGTAVNSATGAGGPTYNLTLTDLSGGSGGGTGGNCTPGGAGGGALQISANDTITVELGGVVNAGGGGAQASSCGGATPAASGGSGAGSGGTILFESRAITIRGVLSANGGSFAADAVVGRGSPPSGPPGEGATVDNVATDGIPSFQRGLGGGGGFGRIALRTSGPYSADVLGASAITPAPTLDTTVP